MTPALRLRKWGGGGGNGFSPPFILHAGGRLELECQSPDRGRKRIGSSDRGKGAPGAPLTSSTPAPRLFGSPSREQRRGAKQPLLGPSAERSEAGTDGGGRKAGRRRGRGRLAGCSPCRTRRTHFPRWLGSAVELVGMSREGGLETPSRSQ